MDVVNFYDLQRVEAHLLEAFKEYPNYGAPIKDLLNLSRKASSDIVKHYHKEFADRGLKLSDPLDVEEVFFNLYQYKRSNLKEMSEALDRALSEPSFKLIIKEMIDRNLVIDFNQDFEGRRNVFEFLDWLLAHKKSNPELFKSLCKDILFISEHPRAWYVLDSLENFYSVNSKFLLNFLRFAKDGDDVIKMTKSFNFFGKLFGTRLDEKSDSSRVFNLRTLHRLLNSKLGANMHKSLAFAYGVAEPEAYARYREQIEEHGPNVFATWFSERIRKKEYADLANKSNIA